MRELSTSIAIDAPAERVWETMIDVERWHEWTASITRIQRLDDRPFGLGSRARVEQPRLPVAVWTVTDWRPGRVFTWVSTGPGFSTTGVHAVEPESPTTSRATLVVRFGGLLAPLVAPFVRRLTTTYMGFEAAGLKRRSEQCHI